MTDQIAIHVIGFLPRMCTIESASDSRLTLLVENPTTRAGMSRKLGRPDHSHLTKLVERVAPNAPGTVDMMAVLELLEAFGQWFESYNGEYDDLSLRHRYTIFTLDLPSTLATYLGK